MLTVNEINKPTFKESSNILFYGTIIYLVIFYLQIGGRVSFLGKVRIEFLWGALFLLIIGMGLLTKRLTIFSNKINIIITIFLMTLFIGIPFAYVKKYALETFIQIIKLFSIYIMIVVTVDTGPKLKTFIWIYIALIAWIFVEPFTWAIRGFKVVTIGLIFL